MRLHRLLRPTVWTLAALALAGILLGTASAGPITARPGSHAAQPAAAAKALRMRQAIGMPFFSFKPRG